MEQKDKQVGRDDSMLRGMALRIYILCQALGGRALLSQLQRVTKSGTTLLVPFCLHQQNPPQIHSATQCYADQVAEDSGGFT